MGRLRKAFQRGKEGARKLKYTKAPPALLKILGEDATAKDAQGLQLQMVQVVLQRMIELCLAQWIEAVLIILRDEFEFSEPQLAHFARLFMTKTTEMVGEQEKATPDNGRT